MAKPVQILWLLTLAALWCSWATAQVLPGAAGMADDLSVASVEARIADLESTPGIDDSTRSAATDLYRSTIEQIQRAQRFADQTVEFRRLADEAPMLLEAIRAELASPPAEPSLTPPEGATLQQLDQSLSLAEADLQAGRQNASELQSESTRRNERRVAITEQTARVRQQLADADDPATVQPRESEAGILTGARRTLQRAVRLALVREIESLEAEAGSYDARRDLLPARRDRAQRRATDTEKLVTAWQAIVTRQRQTDAEQATRDAQRLRREAARQHPVLKGFADETALKAQARTGDQSVAGRIDTISREATEAQSQLASLRIKFASIQRRLDVSGLNRATGLLLRREYEMLPDEASLRSRVRSTQHELEDAEYALIELQEERLGAGDIDRVAQELLNRIIATGAENGQPEFEQAARELATARRDLLDQLIADATTYFNRLIELNIALRDSLDATESYRAFIEERILWVRSIAGDRWPRMDDLRDASAWLFDPPSWGRAKSAILTYVSARWVWVLIGAMLLSGLWVAGFHCRKRLHAIGDLVTRYHTDAFVHTLVALFLTIALTAPIPLAIYAAGWILENADDQVVVAISVGAGMRTAAVFLFTLLFLRQMLRPSGLAEAHFRWPKTTIRPIRRHLRWFTPVVVPVALLVTALDQGGDEAANASLGRVLFTVGLLALSVFLLRVLRPTGPVLRKYLEENKGGWVYRLRGLWRPILVLAPLVFAVLSWLGFHYTALQLEARLEESLVLALTLVLVHGVLLRWLLVARRRVAVDDAKRRRELAAADAEAKRDAGESVKDTVPVLDEEKVDLPALSSQTRQLFRAAITATVVVGLYIIWAQALPALRMLDRVQVWPSIQVIDATVNTESSFNSTGDQKAISEPENSNGGAALPMTPAASLPSAQSDKSQNPASHQSITIADIGFAFIVLIVTWIAFRNIPGLVEIVVLQRLPLDSGSRYALSTILRYCITIIGVVIAFNAIGVSWGKVQWLAAALTFGLAFGLQEIFANFISGLIILVERPIRLGDTVTVGSITGTVTRIRMRATTIADWDRKELVIPNKSFITGEVVNWSLSDPVLRVIIPVGVSYESDVDLVERLLLKVAVKDQIVLDDPKPMVLFKNFGDSTLDFELRIFIPHIDHYQTIRHGLHVAIIKAFRKSGVEIAFPQRDLHVRSIGGLDQVLQKREDLPASEIPGEAH